jgi:hypothetical protein
MVHEMFPKHNPFQLNEKPQLIKYSSSLPSHTQKLLSSRKILGKIFNHKSFKQKIRVWN